MVLDKFQTQLEWKKHKIEKTIKSISAVPIGSKFYGEFESDNQNIDLYRKTMIFDEKMRLKIVISWGVGTYSVTHLPNFAHSHYMLS